jgi:hypothetical protein
MLAVPSSLPAQFEEHFGNKRVPTRLHGVYKKWLRYYLDFCQKYHSPAAYKHSLPQFIQKLQEKKQTKAQQEQAATAIKVYYQILNAKGEGVASVVKILFCAGAC